MILTKKQIRILQFWMVIGALITLFPPHEVDVRSEIKGSEGMTVISRPWLHQSFVLSGGAHDSEYGYVTRHYTPKGIHGLALICELGFVTFVSGFFFFGFRAKE